MSLGEHNENIEHFGLKGHQMELWYMYNKRRTCRLTIKLSDINVGHAPTSSMVQLLYINAEN